MARIGTYIHALVLACAVTAGPAAAAASADHGTPYESATLTRYLQIAEAQWGAPAPTCSGQGKAAVRVHAVLFDSPDPSVSAVAEQPGCRIWLDRDFWPARDDAIDCTIIAHEWGHLLGFGHSEVVGSLMYPMPEHGAQGCGVFGQAHMAPPARKRVRRPAKAVTPKHGVRRTQPVRRKTAPRRCVRRSKVRAGTPRGGRCKRSASGRGRLPR